MAAKKATTKGKRYSESERAEILKFVDQQGRGGASAAAKKFGVSPLTISTWKKATAPARGKAKASGPMERDDVLRTLAERGFKVVRMMNVITGEIMEEKIDPKIEKLNLKFEPLRGRADDNVTYVSESGGQVLATLTLERLLAITGTKP
jgi:transposase-like protein